MAIFPHTADLSYCLGSQVNYMENALQMTVVDSTEGGIVDVQIETTTRPEFKV